MSYIRIIPRFFFFNVVICIIYILFLMREQTGKKEIPLQAHKSDFSENFHSINKITENSSILSSNETEKINGCIIILLSNKN